MKFLRINIFLILLLLTIPSGISCGGSGDGGGNTLRGRIVTESGTPITSGNFSIHGSGVVGAIGKDGTFGAKTEVALGEVLLTGSASGFRFRRVGFDLQGTGSLDLGDITLPYDSLSKGWESYRAGNYPAAVSNFEAHINASGRDIADAYNGLGWAMTRAGYASGAVDNFLNAIGHGFDDDVRSGLAAAMMGLTASGDYSIAEAISNLDLAVGADGIYVSKPLHDDVGEDDLIALRSMLNLIDGRTQAAATDRSTVLGDSGAVLNTQGEDILYITGFFLQ